MATSTYGTPYVQGSDLVSAYPTASSNLATRVDEVSYKRNGLNAQTGTSYSLLASDAGKTITLSNAAAVAVTLPQDSVATLPTGSVVTFYNLGAGAVTISQGTGATLQGGSITLSQYEPISVIKLSANTYGKIDSSASGLSLITTQSFTGAGAVNVNNCFSSTYENYKIIMNLTGVNYDGNWYMRLRVSATDSSAGYDTMQAGVTRANAANNVTNSAASYWLLSTTDAGTNVHAYTASMDVHHANLAQYTTATVNTSSVTTAGVPYGAAGSMLHQVATAYDGFTIGADGAGGSTITGTLRVYGYKNS